MNHSWLQWVDEALELRRREGRLRTLDVPGEGIDFLSNDYLGLNRAGAIAPQALHLLNEWGIQNSGSGGSRLLSGNYPLIEYAENQLAEHLGFESCLIFPSGFQANLALVTAACNRHVTVFCDELVHASLHDALRLSLNGGVYKFRHNDMEHLHTLLQKAPARKLVITESLFSMDGDLCPMAELNAVCRSNDAVVILDEAHALGVFGPEGKGLSHLLDEDVLLASMYGFGKAGACEGGVVACSNLFRSWIINQSRPFIFSTAPSPILVASVLASIAQLAAAHERRSVLNALIAIFRDKINRQSTFHFLDSASPIQALLVPGNDQVMRMAKMLRESGFMIKGIRKPSVPEGSERIRICLHAYNTEEEIGKFFHELKTI